MNIASWIILIIVVIWIGVAIKVAFFGGFGKKGRSCHGTHHDANLPSDEDLRLPSACMGCSKGSCAGCAHATFPRPSSTNHGNERICSGQISRAGFSESRE